MSTDASTRKIKFLSRILPFPTDPTFREYKKIEEITGVTPEQFMTGQAGVWMLPILAIVALMRDNPRATHEQLEKILDLGPQDITLEGKFGDEPDPEEEAADEAANESTGTASTDEAPGPSGTPDSPTTSPAPPESQTT